MSYQSAKRTFIYVLLMRIEDFWDIIWFGFGRSNPQQTQMRWIISAVGFLQHWSYHRSATLCKSFPVKVWRSFFAPSHQSTASLKESSKVGKFLFLILKTKWEIIGFYGTYVCVLSLNLFCPVVQPFSSNHWPFLWCGHHPTIHGHFQSGACLSALSLVLFTEKRINDRRYVRIYVLYQCIPVNTERVAAYNNYTQDMLCGHLKTIHSQTRPG